MIHNLLHIQNYVPVQKYKQEMASETGEQSSRETFLSWTYSGVNFSLDGNGGPECFAVVPLLQRFLETVIFAALGIFEIYYALPRLGLNPGSAPVLPNRTAMNRTGRSLLIAFMSLTFGIELGFKFATHQMIWILNPCHITSVIQIFLLTAQPSRIVTAVFRVHIHAMFGATIALLLPVVNTRLLPFETAVYYIQHIIILVIPFYLMRLGGVYVVEPLTDMTWLMLSHGILFVYHFVILQGIGLLTHVNLNNMLCPAVSDPFYGRYYRLYAFVHQSLLIFLHGKVYTAIALWFLRWQCPSPSAVAASNHEATGLCYVYDMWIAFIVSCVLSLLCCLLAVIRVVSGPHSQTIPKSQS